MAAINDLSTAHAAYLAAFNGVEDAYKSAKGMLSPELADAQLQAMLPTLATAISRVGDVAVKLNEATGMLSDALNLFASIGK